MKILLAVDGSEYSLAAVEEVARGLWPDGSIVRMVSVAELPGPALTWEMEMPDQSFEEWEQILEERALTNLTQASARFGELAGSRTEVRTKVLKGEAKAAILDEAEHWKADLIIVGTHGYNVLERLWLGSVSRAVLSHAKCSVEIVRRRRAQDPERKATKILLPVDGSEFSTAAVEEIAGRPWPQGSEIYVISVVHLPFTPNPETWSLPESYYAQLEKAGRGQAELAINQAGSILSDSNSERETNLKLTTGVIIGHPEEAIIETAKTWGADLIVLGSHGYRGVKRFLVGSVSQAAALHAPCSVEIVRQTPRG